MYVLHMHFCTFNELFYVQVTEPISKLYLFKEMLLKLLRIISGIILLHESVSQGSEIHFFICNSGLILSMLKCTDGFMIKRVSP